MNDHELDDMLNQWDTPAVPPTKGSSRAISSSSGRNSWSSVNRKITLTTHSQRLAFDRAQYAVQARGDPAVEIALGRVVGQDRRKRRISVGLGFAWSDSPVRSASSGVGDGDRSGRGDDRLVEQAGPSREARCLPMAS